MTEQIMDGDKKVPIKNPEGYVDLTAHDAITNILNLEDRDEADQRHYRLIRSLRNIIDLMDYDLLCRIEVKDRRSGRTYR